MPDGFSLGRYLDIVRRTDPLPLCGRVTRTVGLVVGQSSGPRASVGELCMLHRDGRSPLPMEVVGFRDGAPSSPFPRRDRPAFVQAIGSSRAAPSHPRRWGCALLGRVIDGLGNPLDGLGPSVRRRNIRCNRCRSTLAREPIAAPLGTGVRAIDGLLTRGGRGQRIGVFVEAAWARARCWG
jgi:flagellar biosynthesis/type III secretory pathway ATPase